MAGSHPPCCVFNVVVELGRCGIWCYALSEPSPWHFPFPTTLTVRIFRGSTPVIEHGSLRGDRHAH
jgi:hypothetical protein